jgi:hypothetical protein
MGTDVTSSPRTGGDVETALALRRERNERDARLISRFPTPGRVAEGYVPGVTTSTICGIIFPVMRSHEILVFVTRPAWARTEGRHIEDLKETSPSALVSKEMESPS